MAKSEHFSAQVKVGGQELPFIFHDSSVFVETGFNYPTTRWVSEEEVTPFNTIERQNFPYTPFTVKVRSKWPQHVWATIYVDGVRAQHKVLHPGRPTEEFVGFAARLGYSGGEREFCFSMPRPVKKVANGEKDKSDKVSEDRKAELSSIRIDFNQTHLQYTEERGIHHGVNGAAYQVVNKDDCKAANVNSAVRAGSTLGHLHVGGKSSIYTPATEENRLYTIRIKYRTREELVLIGAKDPPQDAAYVDMNLAGSVSNSNKRKFEFASLEKDIAEVLGLDLSDEVRGAFRGCSSMFMAVLPEVRPPKIPMPSSFSEGRFDLCDSEAFATKTAMEKLKQASGMEVKEISGDPLEAAVRAVAHQMFRVESMGSAVHEIARTNENYRSLGEHYPLLKALAQALCCYFLVFVAGSSQPFIVKSSYSKFQARCYCLGISTLPGPAQRRQFFSLVDAATATAEREARESSKRQRKSGGDNDSDVIIL